MIAAESRVVKVLISHQKALENMDIDSERNINCYLQFSLVVYLVIDANGRGLIFFGVSTPYGKGSRMPYFSLQTQFQNEFSPLN